MNRTIFSQGLVCWVCAKLCCNVFDNTFDYTVNRLTNTPVITNVAKRCYALARLLSLLGVLPSHLCIRSKRITISAELSNRRVATPL